MGLSQRPGRMSSRNSYADQATLLLEQTRRQSRFYGSVKGRILLLLEHWALRVAIAIDYSSLRAEIVDPSAQDSPLTSRLAQKQPPVGRKTV
jgi:hypothetical protein